MRRQSNLASQLEVLKRAQGEGAKIPTGTVPSFLFDIQDAYSLDIDLIYAMGRKGLEELSRINNNLYIYKESLFSPESRAFSRYRTDTTVVRNIDSTCKDLISKLCPYFQLTPCHQVLEYLIRKYEVSEHMGEHILTTFLPYMEDPKYLRLIQLTNWRGHPSWGWVQQYADQGLLLTRQLLIREIRDSPELISMITQVAITYSRESVNALNRGDQDVYILTTEKAIHPYITFFGVLFSEMLTTYHCQGEVLIALLSSISEGIKLIRGGNSEWLRALGLLISALVIRNQLSEEYLEAIFTDLSRVLTEQFLGNAKSIDYVVKLMGVMCLSQPGVIFNSSVLLNIFNHPQICNQIAKCCKKADLSWFVVALTLGVTITKGDEYINMEKLLEILKAIINTNIFSRVIFMLVDSLLKSREEWNIKNIVLLLSKLEVLDSLLLGKCLMRIYEKCEGETQELMYKNLKNLKFFDQIYIGGGLAGKHTRNIPLFLAIGSENPKVQKSGMQQMIKNLENNKGDVKTYETTIILKLIEGPNSLVLRMIIENLHIFYKYFDSLTLNENLFQYYIANSEILEKLESWEESIELLKTLLLHLYEHGMQNPKMKGNLLTLFKILMCNSQYENICQLILDKTLNNHESLKSSISENVDNLQTEWQGIPLIIEFIIKNNLPNSLYQGFISQLILVIPKLKKFYEFCSAEIISLYSFLAKSLPKLELLKTQNDNTYIYPLLEVIIQNIPIPFNAKLTQTTKIKLMEISKSLLYFIIKNNKIFSKLLPVLLQRLFKSHVHQVLNILILCEEIDIDVTVQLTNILAAIMKNNFNIESCHYTNLIITLFHLLSSDHQRLRECGIHLLEVIMGTLDFENFSISTGLEELKNMLKIFNLISIKKFTQGTKIPKEILISGKEMKIFLKSLETHKENIIFDQNEFFQRIKILFNEKMKKIQGISYFVCHSLSLIPHPGIISKILNIITSTKCIQLIEYLTPVLKTLMKNLESNPEISIYRAIQNLIALFSQDKKKMSDFDKDYSPYIQQLITRVEVSQILKEEHLDTILGIFRRIGNDFRHLISKESKLEFIYQLLECSTKAYFSPIYMEISNIFGRLPFTQTLILDIIQQKIIPLIDNPNNSDRICQGINYTSLIYEMFLSLPNFQLHAKEYPVFELSLTVLQYFSKLKHTEHKLQYSTQTIIHYLNKCLSQGVKVNDSLLLRKVENNFMHIIEVLKSSYFIIFQAFCDNYNNCRQNIDGGDEMMEQGHVDLLFIHLFSQYSELFSTLRDINSPQIYELVEDILSRIVSTENIESKEISFLELKEYILQIIHKLLISLFTTENEGNSLEIQHTNSIQRILTIYISSIITLGKNTKQRIESMGDIITPLDDNLLAFSILLLIQEALKTLKIKFSGGGLEMTEGELNIAMKLMLNLRANKRIAVISHIMLYLLRMDNISSQSKDIVKTKQKIMTDIVKGSGAYITYDATFDKLKNYKNIRKLKYLAFYFISQVLETEEFLQGLIKYSKKPEFIGEISNLFKITFASIQELTKIVSNRTLTNKYMKSVKTLVIRVEKIVTNIRSLISFENLVKVALDIISSKTPKVFIRIKISIIQIVLEESPNISEERTRKPEINQILSPLLEKYIEYLNLSRLTSKAPKKNEIILIQLILSTFSKVCSEELKDIYTQQIPETLNILMNYENSLLKSSTLICYTSIIEQFNLLIAPYLETLFKHIWVLVDKYSENYSSETEEESLVFESVLRVLFSLVKYIPHFINEDIGKIMSIILHMNDKFLGLGKELSVMIGKNIDTQVIFKGILSTLGQAYDAPTSCLELYFTILRETFNNLKLSYVTENYKTLLRLLLNIFDFPVNYFHKKGHDHADVGVIDSYFIQIYQEFLLKINENQLKKLFPKITKWATRKMKKQVRIEEKIRQILYESLSYCPSRLIIFFKLTNCTLETLHSMFIPYYELFSEIILESLPILSSIFAQKPPKNPLKRNHVELEIREGHSLYTLLKTMVTTIQLLFVNDTETSIQVEQFEKLIPLISALVEVIGLGEMEYKTFMSNEVSPCIVQMFESTNNDDIWKLLNYQLLLKTRMQESSIKIGVFGIVKELLDKMGQRYLILLNDIVPFLVEAVEHHNPQVEAIAKEIFTMVETITGESISSYIY